MPASLSSSSKNPLGASAKLGAFGLTAAASIGGLQNASAQTVFTFTPTSDNSISYSDTSSSQLYIDVTGGTVSTTNVTNNADYAIILYSSSSQGTAGKAQVYSPTGSVDGESVVTSTDGSGTTKPYVTPLNAGDSISAESNLTDLGPHNPVALSSTTGAPNTGFTTGGTYYVGFAFDNNSTTDYGWLNVTTTVDSNVNPTGPTTVTVNSFAYEDGGSGIVAGGGALSAVPEPADTAAIIGGMALVAGSVMMYRRRQERAGASFAA